MRKALQTEQGKSDMESRIQGLEADCKDYERQVTEWRSGALKEKPASHVLFCCRPGHC
jgi:hypothetical protein